MAELTSTGLPADGGKRVVVAVGGGIAAYKTATVVSRLAQEGHSVRVAMTEAATRFVGPATFSALSGASVATALFDPARYPLGSHIQLAEGADLMVVAPASADLLGCFAAGLAPCVVSTLYLQMQCRVLVAPAMSNVMWEKPSVQRNVRRLQDDGVLFVGPDAGWLSCRQSGAGRMAEPDVILKTIRDLLTPVV